MKLPPFALALWAICAHCTAATPPSIESLSVEPQSISLDSPYAYAQLVATAHLAGGEAVDVTRMAKIETADAGVAQASKSGFVHAVADGDTQLTISIHGHHATVPVRASGTAAVFEPDYVRDVMPVISRLGCNAGTCHGSKDGKNGFKLSLRGYDPLYDIRAFTDDLGSRRVNPAAPGSSLMLLKATGAVPHEGGGVTTADTDAYAVLRDWIGGGAKLDLTTPKVTKIEVHPINPVVQGIGTRQQMRVVATYADGATRDVTREAFVESGNTEVAEPSGEAGAIALIETLRRGEAPVLVRYEGNYAATTVTVMGDRTGFAWEQPPTWNRIDELVAAKWQRMKIKPSGLCDDYEFIRRAHLDLTGLPPRPAEVREFVRDKTDTRKKREALVDKLVGGTPYTDHWANKWADMLMVNSKFLGKEGAAALREWIRGEVERNTPYNEFVEKIITASGSNKTNPPAGYYKILRDPEALMENTTHLFLATRFNCNKCHDHPFERWTQDQYYEMAAYFAQVELKRDDASGKRKIGGTAVEGAKPLYEIVSDKKSGEVQHERTGAVTAPAFPYPGGFDFEGDRSRRQQLADWITAPNNRYFASSYANRLWGYMTGTGIIEPLDDIRAGNPPSNPELLDFLEQEFVGSGFDVRHMLRLICKSRTYGLSVETNKWNADDDINFSHARARRLPAEVLFDTIHAALGARPDIPGVPAGTRAAALPDVGIKLPDGFLDNTGRPVRESSCECERSSGLQLGPIMALVSGPTVGNAISNRANALPKLVAGISDDKKLANELFMRLLSRPATEAEIEASLGLIGQLDAGHAALVTTRDERQAELQASIDKAAAAREQEITVARMELENFREKVAAREAELDAAHAEKLEAAKAQLASYESKVPAKFARWAAESVGETAWKTLKPVAMNSSIGTRLTLGDDGSVFADGKNGKGLYRISGATTLKDITGVRLEALADERLPKSGPGRAPNDGNFVLTELEVFSSPLPDKAAWQVAKRWEFETPGDTEGWGDASGIDINVESGALKLTSRSEDPQLSAAVSAPAGSFALELRGDYPGEGTAHPQLFWTTEKEPEIHEARSTRITVQRGAKDWTNYRFHFTTDSPLKSIRFDPLDDKSAAYFQAIRLIRTDAPQPVKLSLENASADFSQTNYDVATAIDGKRDPQNNGWAIAPKMGENHTATFEIKDLPATPGGRRLLRFDFDQQYQGNNWSLGKFRISLTSSPKPVSFGLPDTIKATLAKAEADRSDDEKKALEKFYRDNNGDLKALKAKVADAEKPRTRDPELVKRETSLAEAEKPLPVDPRLARLRADVELSQKQLAEKRLTAAQDIAWAIINTPEFLFNR